jgi:glycosyltransferase involved in cell wall biosynthesis
LGYCLGKGSETWNILLNIFPSRQYSSIDTDEKIKVYHNPWEWRMGKNMGRIQRSLAISHCTSDYIILLDADEVIHERDFDKIQEAMSLGHDCYSFRTLHFYRDFEHIKKGPNKSDPGQVWYDHRPKMFKNNLGIFDMHDNKGNYSGLVTFKGIDCQEISKKTSIEIFHAGHVRSKEVYVDKQNKIEKSYHPEWKEKDFDWDMSGTQIYRNSFPKVLLDRIKEHKNKYPEYYND